MKFLIFVVVALIVVSAFAFPETERKVIDGKIPGTGVNIHQETIRTRSGPSQGGIASRTSGIRSDIVSSIP